MTKLDPPQKRECQSCGREDVWDSEKTNWRIKTDTSAGDPFCIHEWDINGAYRPIQR